MPLRYNQAYWHVHAKGKVMGNEKIQINVWISAESVALLKMLAERQREPLDHIVELALAVFQQHISAQPVSASSYPSSDIDKLSVSLAELEHRIAAHLVGMRNDFDVFNSRLNAVERGGSSMSVLAELDHRLRSVESMAGFSTTELEGLRQRVAMLEELSRGWDYLDTDRLEVDRKHRASRLKK